MSKNWYPVIDYVNCGECGACISKFKQNVYDKTKFPTPIVVHKEGCIEGCRGCGNLCLNNAIEYVGDKGNNKSNCNCGGNC